MRAMATLSDPRPDTGAKLDGAAERRDLLALLPGALPALAQSRAQPAWIDGLSESSAGFVEGLRARQPPLCDQAMAGGDTEQADLALEEAYRRGVDDGRQAAEAEVQAKDRAARELRMRFGQLDSAALESMERALASTVLSLCEQVLQQHASDPDALAERCRKAAHKLGDAAQDCALHLNPEDVPLLAKDFAQQWRIVEDELLERGSVLFEGADGLVSDGPAEWREAIAEAIGCSQ